SPYCCAGRTHQLCASALSRRRRNRCAGPGKRRRVAVYQVKSSAPNLTAGQKTQVERSFRRVLDYAKGRGLQVTELLATSLFGDPAAGLYEDDSARLREHLALLRLLNLAPDPRAVAHLDLPADDKELPETDGQPDHGM